MKPLMVGICALSIWAGAAVPVSAGWNNVFQPTLFGRCRHQQQQTAKYYAPPVVVQSSPVVALAPAAPCNTCYSPPPCSTPCNNCTTSYTQRCFYQPVTAYESRSYYEPVTTVQTSYYYEPVMTYRYSCYVDPCTGCSQQVAVPTTSYQLRAQSCPVQSWVQRCVQVPVTVMQKSCYWQPQTTCCQTTVGALIPMDPGAVAPGSAAPPTITPSTTPAPQTNPPPPSIKGEGGDYNRYYPPQIPEKATPNASWKPSLGAPSLAAPVVPTTNPPPPAVKLENIVVGPEATVDGQVVRSDNTPRPGAKIWFVNAGAQAARQEVTANTAGRFQVTLASGSYHVYLQAADGATNYHSRIDVDPASGGTITLVNR
ncbi:MAG: carboxypeptidase regulatory-like domain-containing protein [Planctomycetes bacterium]|nr:carboxypeptidase regulatory-like domain-containing protein [Planctomycetota bacterium]